MNAHINNIAVMEFKVFLFELIMKIMEKTLYDLVLVIVRKEDLRNNSFQLVVGRPLFTCLVHMGIWVVLLKFNTI